LPSAQLRQQARIRRGRGVFATPRCRISARSIRFARYLLRDPADADDAVQECHLRAPRHLDTLRIQDVKPWLLAVLRNVCRVE
jgi:DNA-directed RNA polymerase specialized sigma24 family protein